MALAAIAASIALPPELLLFALFLVCLGERACRSNIVPHTSDPAILHFQTHIGLPRDAAIVGDYNHSLTLLGELLQQLDDPFAIAVIQVAGRLVRQDHPRVIGQRARDRYPLFLPTR